MQKKIINSVVALIILIIGYFTTTEYNEPKTPLPKGKKHEKYYQTKMCNKLGGKIEYVLFDKTRVDCLTKEYAIEVDWAKKWAEGIGQALYYAEITHKKPAVALIVGDKRDDKYLKRLKTVAKEFNIKIIILEKE
ncbi:hypothetical protein MNB_SV-9-1436 [hydrothermal vent metagenome]|uniref:Uncharacterized protein n=1 Tax=hydrothermal vent metagenome TaxID=652676 RepID=A0A1W1C6D3_9ZZZZ